MKFRHQGADVELGINASGGQRPSHYTWMRVAWPYPKLRCEIFPEKWSALIGRMLGMEDLTIASRYFDAQYVIRSNEPETIRALLSDEVQKTIDSLRYFVTPDDISVSIGGGQLTIRKGSRLAHHDGLARFIKLSLLLYDQAFAAVTAGVEIVESESNSIDLATVDVMCQICGEVIRRNCVLCRSCNTPHHKDCWEYYGSCSTFACGQRIYRYPKRIKTPPRR
jgi:hypothetical protein